MINYKFIQHIQVRHSTVTLIMVNKVFEHYFSVYAYVQNVSHKSNKFR